MQAHLFFQQALIYMAAAVIAVPIAKRLGLGSVLGFLLAGMIIGPWGLKLITNVTSIIEFAQFGVALLLFLIGLELNPQRLWRLRRSILGMGAVQVISTIFIFSGISLGFGLSLSVALVVGMGLAMSSTAIALQSLTEKKLLDTSAGQASISVSLFQDMMVIPLLLLLSRLAPSQATDGVTHWSTIGEDILLILGLIIAGRYLLRPLLRIIASTGLREIFIAFSLLLVIGTAFLMQTIGLSMALGTFLAGVLLADSEYRYQLELDIEPFKGLLLGLFFIAIGMSLNIGLFWQHAILILCITFAVVLIKVIILFIIARSFKENRTDAQTFACYLSQVGEFAFVLFNAAYMQNILTTFQVDMLKCIVAISMLTTPFILIAHEKWQIYRKHGHASQQADKIDEHNPVIIAGFGRVGGVIGRLLNAKGVRTTVIDRDPNQIDLVRRFGYRAYYGDITRLDLLVAAGAAKAKLLILAIDDPVAIMETIHLVRQYFPHLKMLARARGRADAFDLIAEDVPVFRETFETAIIMGEAALVALGYGVYTARRSALRFLKLDLQLLERGAHHRHDQKELISIAQQGRIELEKLLAGEERGIHK